MPIDVSHFTMVGFALNLGDESAFVQSEMNLAGDCPVKDLTATDVVCVLKDQSGAELRIGLRRDAGGRLEYVTIDPAYRGEGRLRLSVNADISDPEGKPFESTLSAHFGADNTPIAFELADPFQATDVKPGYDVAMDITAFAFKPQIFADRASYLEVQKSERTQFAPDHFFPSGLFSAKSGGAMPEGAKQPTAYADFAGEILKCELKKNTIGGGKFWWALVKTHGDNTLDVVLDPSSVVGGLKAGEIIRGRFWLSAEVAQD